MKIIAMMNQKGGVSKTTLGLCLASRWHLQGKDVAVVDCDPQASVMHWKSVQDSDSRLAGIQVYQPESPADLVNLHELSHDYLVLDCPGTDKIISRAALGACDVVLVPTRPSAFDIRASAPTVQSALAASKPMAYVITCVVSRSDLGAEAMAALQGSSAGLVKKAMGQYTAYTRALGAGETPLTAFPGTPASRNIEALGQAVEEVFKWR